MKYEDLTDLYNKYLSGALSEDELTDEERIIITEMINAEITTLESAIN